MNLFEEILKVLPKKLKRTRKRPNASGIDMDYVKHIKGTLIKNTCVLPGLTKTGKRKVNHGIGNLAESQTFGKTKSMFVKNAPIIDRVGNRMFPKVYEMLKKIADIHFPDFEYQDICLNHNFKCEPHFDKKNRGASYIVGFGDYTGGELNIDSKKNDIRHKPLKFNGFQSLHWVEDWVGDRWTAVYFKKKL
tara:strand:+ start:2106 stop:2678 length:573 start_codon:yes stop_codon:yes gene_type:complete